MNCNVPATVSEVIVAFASMVTVCAAAIVTLSVAPGTTPPTHVAGALQFPIAAEVMFAADNWLYEPSDNNRTNAKIIFFA